MCNEVLSCSCCGYTLMVLYPYQGKRYIRCALCGTDVDVLYSYIECLGTSGCGAYEIKKINNYGFKMKACFQKEKELISKITEEDYDRIQKLGEEDRRKIQAIWTKDYKHILEISKAEYEEQKKLMESQLKKRFQVYSVKSVNSDYLDLD
jgi:hypothetical protein